MKKTMKWLALILLTPVVLFLVLAGLLYFPPVQNWAVGKVCAYASEQTGLDIAVDNVRLAFPLDLEINGFKMIRPANDSLPADTLADVGRLIVDVAARPLLDGQVEINAMELTDAKVNTADYIDAVRIKGTVGRLYLQSHGIDLSKESVRVNTAALERSRLDIVLPDSVPPDTTESQANWQVDIDRMDISQTGLTIHLPGKDSGVSAQMEQATIKAAALSLGDGTYRVGAIDWNGGTLDYGKGIAAFGQRDDSRRQRGFDADYLSMSGVAVGIDSLLFVSAKEATVHPPRPAEPMLLSMNIRTAQFQEKSGLQVDECSGQLTLNDTRLTLKDARVKTPHSTVAADIQMDLNTFDEQQPGKLYADVDAKIGRHDLQVFAPDLPQAMMRRWPNQPLQVQGHAEGNMQYVSFKNLHAQLPSVFDMKATGWVAHPTDVDRLRADVQLKGRTGDLSMVTDMLPPDTRKQFNLPKGIGLDGRIKADGPQYATDMRLTEGGGNAHVSGSFNTKSQAYDLKVQANNLQLAHFLPGQGLGTFSGDVQMQGRGTDFLSPTSGANVRVNVRQFSYGGYQLDGIGGDVSLRNGMIHAKVDSRNPMVSGRFDVDGQLTDKHVDIWLKGHISQADLKRLGVTQPHYIVAAEANVHVTSDLKNRHSVSGHLGDFALSELRNKGTRVPLVNGDFDIDGTMNGQQLAARFDGMLNRVDLYQLGVTDQPFTTAFGANLDLASNLDDYYNVQGNVCNLHVQDKDSHYDAGDMALDVLTRRDTTHAVVSSADFWMNMDARGGYQRLLKQAQTLANDISRQIDDKRIDHASLRAKLPDGHVSLHSGHDNIFARLLAQQGYRFDEADMDLTSRNNQGLTGGGHITALTLTGDSITMDSISLALTSEDSGLDYDLHVVNRPQNNYPFSGQLRGTLGESSLLAQATILDAAGKKGMDLGLKAEMASGGIRMNITSDNAIIGYKSFNVNKENYILVGNDQRVSADMKLHAADGAGVYIYTDDSDTDALQNITLNMHQFDLEKVFDVLPYTPAVSGVLDGDFHVIQTRDELTISSDMTVNNLTYEHSPMGNVGTQLVYMPQSDGSHYVDAIITKDGTEVGTLTGTYRSEGDGYLDASFVLDQFPLSYANGFIPDQIVGLRGTGEGELSVKGPLNRLDINGEVYLANSHLYSTPYGLDMRFADDPVRIVNSKLLFENFEMFANNNSPLSIQGSLDFSNTSRMMLDVMMKAQNFLLIDAKENARSEAYGKAYVNFFGRMNGPLNQLNMRGKLDVLGNTDMTYVMRESALTSDNQLDELVKFVDFNDSTAEKVVVRPDIMGFNMDLSIGIDEQAHIVCALNADHSNYIDLIGGGDLRMSYDPTNDLRLTGRYTLNSGEMKYALPVIPLRTFTIQNGSYIEFTGDPMNPTLNITATENVKTSVDDGSPSGKMVDFDCGVMLTQTLAKPGIEFIIEAPEDMQVQNELNTKSTEERGKLAVSMLASGMYLGDGNGTGNAAMSGALASFVQSEINNITGSALRSIGLDLSANMETSTDASGSLHTDYTFKFSKRLWNNRLRIIMGGRLSTGSSNGDENGAFFDNFSMEYRLNQGETQYLKLFYERDAYDWLEGNLSEFGAGFLWRRKLDHFGDIVKFKQAPAPVPEPNQGNQPGSNPKANMESSSSVSERAGSVEHGGNEKETTHE